MGNQLDTHFQERAWSRSSLNTERLSTEQSTTCSLVWLPILQVTFEGYRLQDVAIYRGASADVATRHRACFVSRVGAMTMHLAGAWADEWMARFTD